MRRFGTFGPLTWTGRHPGRGCGSLHPEVTEDLPRRPLPLVGTALHVALEVDRAVLAGEVQVALAHALVAGVPVAVTGRPVRVLPVAVRVLRPRRQRGPAIPLPREPRQHGLDLAEERRRGRSDVAGRLVAERSRRRVGAREGTAGVVDQ